MLANEFLDMLKGDGQHYRKEYQKHYLKNFENRHHKCHPRNHLTNESSQLFKDHSISATTHIIHDDCSAVSGQRRYQMDQAKSSGGDADRNMYDAKHTSLYEDTQYWNDQTHSMRNSGCINKAHSVAKPNKSVANTEKYQQVATPMVEPVDKFIGDQRCLCETASNVSDICNDFEGASSISQKSSKTVLSRTNSHILRKLVKSKCKLQEQVDKTLQQMCYPEETDKSDGYVQNMSYDIPTMQIDTLPPSHCEHCTEKMQPTQLSQKDVTTEIGKTDFAKVHDGDTLTISLDDVVNSKVINPMIRKLQRMYLSNLKEEMSIMEDLESLPHKVNEVYKAAIFKQRD